MTISKYYNRKNSNQLNPIADCSRKSDPVIDTQAFRRSLLANFGHLFPDIYECGRFSKPKLNERVDVNY